MPQFDRHEFTTRQKCIAHLNQLHGDRLEAMLEYLELANTAPVSILNRGTAFLEDAMLVASLSRNHRFGDKYD